MRQKSETRATPEQIVKDIRRATRKQHSAEEKIRIVLDGIRGEYSIAELCRRERIAESLYYSWSKEFLEAGKRRLAGDTARAATSGEVTTLRREVRDMKILVAGVDHPTPIEEVTAADWDATVNINLRAVYFCTKYAVPELRRAKGNVVNVASILGLGGRGTGSSLYCASKGGVVNLTRDLAIELAPDIRVNCICPGAVDTEMLQERGRSLGQGDVTAGYAILTQNRPMKRVARTSEVANSILYFASDLASFVTGSIHVVDGGVMAKAG